MKLNLRNLFSFALLTGAIALSAQTVTYNFSEIFPTAPEGSVSAAGQFGAMNILTGNEYDGSGVKSVEGVNSIVRLKTGGAATYDETTLVPITRAFGFPVSGAGKLTCWVFSSSSTGGGRYVVLNVVKDNAIVGERITTAIEGQLTGSQAEDKEYEYTGEAGEMFLSSSTGGLNFYQVRFEPSTTGINRNELKEFVYNGSTVTVKDAFAMNVYSIAGQKVVSTQGEAVSMQALPKGVYIVEAVLTNGKAVTAKIAR